MRVTNASTDCSKLGVKLKKKYYKITAPNIEQLTNYILIHNHIPPHSSRHPIFLGLLYSSKSPLEQ